MARSGAGDGMLRFVKDTRYEAGIVLLARRRAQYPPPMRLRVSTHLGSSRVARAIRYASTAALCVLLAACADQPVSWDPARVDSARGDVVVTPDGTLRPDSLAVLAARLPSPDTAMCPGSLVLARAAGHLFAAWWHVRPDSFSFNHAAPT